MRLDILLFLIVLIRILWEKHKEKEADLYAKRILAQQEARRKREQDSKKSGP